MAATSTLPTLSQIEAFETDHLGAAATHWSSTAERWEDSFAKLALHMPFPDGDPWLGDAGDAAQRRADTDLITVRTVTDELRGAASIARRAEADLDTAKRDVLSAVAGAEANGFTVGEDLSVTDATAALPPALQAARHAQAQAFAVQLRTGAAQLAALDDQVAAEIGSAAAGVGTLGFSGRADAAGQPAGQEAHHPARRQPHLPPTACAQSGARPGKRRVTRSGRRARVAPLQPRFPVQRGGPRGVRAGRAADEPARRTARQQGPQP
jgi:hypothetical protein